MRIVLDTNILVSALITKGTPPDRLFQAWLRNEFELITSVAQMKEVSDVVTRPRLARFIDADEAAQMVAGIRESATVLGEIPITRRSPDPKDDAILAAAVAGDAELVISGDKRDMLALKEVAGIPIRSARDACAIVFGEDRDR